MEYKYSLKKQLDNDYFTVLGLIGAIVFSVFFIGIVSFGIVLTKRDGVVNLVNSDKIIFGLVFGILTLLCLFSFVFRIFRGKYLVNNGLAMDAEVVNVFYDRDRGRVEYIYKIDGKEIKRGNGIHVSKTSGKYNSGDKIKILVDPKNHKKAIIKNTAHNRSLYVSSLRSSAPLGRWRSLAFWLALPPVGGQTTERRNILPSASQGHMPAPAWQPSRARRIAPERYAKFG
jgi:hypothetical protein